jgi:hypothetical protein
MTAVLVGGDKRRRLAPAVPWQALTAFGVLFMLAGLIDTGFALVPFVPNDVGWRFSTGLGIIAGMPVLVLGLTVFTMASAMLERTWAIATAMLLSAIVIAAVILLITFVLSALPTLLEGAPVAEHLGLKKAAVRAVVLAVLYGSVAGTVFAFCLRGLRESVAS